MINPTKRVPISTSNRKLARTCSTSKYELTHRSWSSEHVTRNPSQMRNYMEVASS
uniref:Uncharacterized protein n=1 Tax=Oryza brachyantha TaxID=4533 RepID=J3MDM9_ORYBR